MRSYFRSDFTSNHSLLPIVALERMFQPQSCRVDRMFTRWVVLLRSVPLLPHSPGEEGQARTVLALEDYRCGPSGASSWLGGAGMPGYRAGRLPCSDSADRPAPGARAGAAYLVGRPVLQAGRRAWVPCPTRSRERGRLRLPARSDWELAPLASVQPPWR